MKFYPDFMAMFNAQSCLERDVVVFNGFSELCGLIENKHKFKCEQEGHTYKFKPVDSDEIERAVERVKKYYDPSVHRENVILRFASPTFRNAGFVEGHSKLLTEVPEITLSLEYDEGTEEVSVSRKRNGREKIGYSCNVPNSFRFPKRGSLIDVDSDKLLDAFADCLMPNNEEKQLWYGENGIFADTPENYCNQFILVGFSGARESINFTLKVAEELKAYEESRKERD